MKWIEYGGTIVFAQYLALAESLSAQFWTADQRLFHSLEGLGVDWVHAF